MQRQVVLETRYKESSSNFEELLELPLKVVDTNTEVDLLEQVNATVVTRKRYDFVLETACPVCGGNHFPYNGTGNRAQQEEFLAKLR